MAGAGPQPSLAAQMSRVMLAEFGLSSAVLDAMATIAKTSMLGLTESASVLNELISSAGVQVSITPSIYEVVTSILGEGGSVVGEETCERSSFGTSKGDLPRALAERRGVQTLTGALSKSGRPLSTSLAWLSCSSARTN